MKKKKAKSLWKKLKKSTTTSGTIMYRFLFSLKHRAVCIVVTSFESDLLNNPTVRVELDHEHQVSLSH